MVQRRAVGNSRVEGLRSNLARDALAPLFGLFVLGWGTNQFAPLILFYPEILPVTSVGIQSLFVLYGATLIPMLLVGGVLSDRFGRAAVFLVAVALAGTSSALLLCVSLSPAVIVGARILIGISCGIGFSSGTAWVTETLVAPKGSRLALILMTGGMGAGSLIVGIFASRLLVHNIPNPQIWVMGPHVLLALVAVALLLFHHSGRRFKPRMFDTRTVTQTPEARQVKAGLRDPVFLRYVFPLAPWTLFCTAVPLATLPSNVPAGLVQDPLLLSAFLTPLPALGGILVQPFAGKARVSPVLLAPLALAIAVLALAISIVSIQAQSVVLLITACLVFGLAHGFCQITGLRLVAEISPPHTLGRNTAVFQALSYVGFLAPLPIALLMESLTLSQVLSGALVLALVTLIWLLPWRRTQHELRPIERSY